MLETKIEIRVRYGETDAMGYLYYGNYALYYEVGRTDMIRSLGITYKELETSGLIMPVTEYHTQFLRPALYDELVTVKTILREWPENRRITFYSELYNEEGKLLNTGSVTLAFVDTATGKTCELPSVLSEKLLPFFNKRKD